MCVSLNSSAKPVVEKIRGLRLCISDFDTLEIIGRGAFGEVKVLEMQFKRKRKNTGHFFSLSACCVRS